MAGIYYYISSATVYLYMQVANVTALAEDLILQASLHWHAGHLPNIISVAQTLKMWMWKREALQRATGDSETSGSESVSSCQLTCPGRFYTTNLDSADLLSA